MRNTSLRKTNISGYKGVSLHSNKKLWVLQIGVGKQKPFFASFKSKYEAALAYNMLAKHHHGEFAYFNDVHFA